MVHKLSYYLHSNYQGTFQAPLALKNITVIFVSKLSGLQCINYHVIYTTVIRVMFSKDKIFKVKVISYVVCILSCYLHRNYQSMIFNNFYPGVKGVTTVFVRGLSALLCVYYHPIYTKFTKDCFSIFFLGSNGYHSVCTWVINFVVSILSCYLHTSYRTRLFNIFLVERLSWCLHASYHLCFAYIAMIFAQKLPGVLFSTTFILGLKELP